MFFYEMEVGCLSSGCVQRLLQEESILRLKLCCECVPVSEILFTKRGKIGDPRIILKDTNFIFKKEKNSIITGKKMAHPY